MICDNCFCVYNKNKKCIIKEPEINVMGTCDNCIYVEPDTDYLDALKLKILKSWGDEGLWNDFNDEDK